ncbi:MAG: hypothetical protein ISR95_07465 [Candidatus Marinimicrobia bacterium]|nr:hypothetical protein [Candidatus Neomarinimicrobiota bacterium]MBL7047442.1 hypothetical protein [Candidatus Neomarinimicrobiota bacterium]
MRQLKYVEEEQKLVLAQVKSYITESGLGDQVHYLTSIPGVGPIMALIQREFPVCKGGGESLILCFPSGEY